MAFCEKPVTEWDQLVEYSNREKWLYRGMKDCTWPLATSLERCFDRARIAPGERGRREEGLIREFRRACHQYSLHVPEPDNILETLALMQHHGAPTRLLDVTYSMYIAAYFALEDVEDHKKGPKGEEPNHCVIWGVNGKWALAASANLFVQGRKDKDAVDVIREHVTTVLFGEAREKLNKVLFFTEPQVASVSPINTYRLNERLRAQKGIFLMPGNVSKSFEDNLAAMPGHDKEENLVKLTIPAAKRTSFIKQLYDMNISRTVLFPGLDGFARSLGVYSPAYNAGPWVKPGLGGVWEPP
jgi:hypothetical protein